MGAGISDSPDQPQTDYVAKHSLELQTLLPPRAECGDCRCVPPHIIVYLFYLLFSPFPSSCVCVCMCVYHVYMYAKHLDMCTHLCACIWRSRATVRKPHQLPSFREVRSFSHTQSLLVQLLLVASQVSCLRDPLSFEARIMDGLSPPLGCGSSF